MTTRDAGDGRLTRRSALGLGLIACCFPTGCKLTGYSVRAPYDLNVKTVYVPTFQSVTFRRDINLRLTELVIKEIERRTPYKVVGKPGDAADGTLADSTLSGTINYSEKNIVVESPYNLPRQLTATMVVFVTWTDNKAEPTNTNPAAVAETFNFYPEIGETAEAAFYRNCEKMATQIVNMMEQTW
jgi:hypothetical protein